MRANESRLGLTPRWGVYPRKAMDGVCFRGFTFTEVMIAVLIMAVGLIPVFMVFTRGSAGTMMTFDEITAHTCAGELLDYAVSLGYDRLNPGDNPETSFPALSKVNSKFKRVLHVQEILPSGGWKNWPMAYKVLSAKIGWDARGIQQSFVLTTIVFKGKN